MWHIQKYFFKITLHTSIISVKRPKENKIKNVEEKSTKEVRQMNVEKDEMMEISASCEKRKDGEKMKKQIKRRRKSQ